MTQPTDLCEMLNANLGGWNTAMGLRFVRATTEECVGELVIGPQARALLGRRRR